MGIGITGVSGAAEGKSRNSGLFIAAMFSAGILVSLVALGGLAGRFGGILTESFGRYWSLAMALMSLSAAIVAFLGPRLKIRKLAELRRPGLAGAFLYGFTFSLGTSAAPLLLVLTVAAAQGKTVYGMALALVFGFGRGLPFLLLGLFAGGLSRLTRLVQWRRAIELASGAALLLVSAYYGKTFLSLL